MQPSRQPVKLLPRAPPKQIDTRLLTISNTFETDQSLILNSKDIGGDAVFHDPLADLSLSQGIFQTVTISPRVTLTDPILTRIGFLREKRIPVRVAWRDQNFVLGNAAHVTYSFQPRDSCVPNISNGFRCPNIRTTKLLQAGTHTCNAETFGLPPTHPGNPAVCQVGYENAQFLRLVSLENGFQAEYTNPITLI
jgi:hypothetical protein